MHTFNPSGRIGRQRKTNLSETEAILICKMSSMIGRTVTQRSPVSSKQAYKQKEKKVKIITPALKVPLPTTIFSMLML